MYTYYQCSDSGLDLNADSDPKSSVVEPYPEL
jgi:hypothetical protein